MARQLMTPYPRGTFGAARALMPEDATVASPSPILVRCAFNRGGIPVSPPQKHIIRPHDPRACSTMSPCSIFLALAPPRITYR